MLSHKDEVIVNTFSNMKFEPAEVSFLGMVSNVSMKNGRNTGSGIVNIKFAYGITQMVECSAMCERSCTINSQS